MFQAQTLRRRIHRTRGREQRPRTVHGRRPPGLRSRALYGDYLADPALLRLIAWKRLEISGDAYLYGALETNDAAHRDAIAEQQRAGDIRSDITPADVWSLVISAA